MSLDYTKLSQVADDLKFGRKAKATAEGLSVVIDDDSPLNKLTTKKQTLILGDAEVRRIVDSNFEGTEFTDEEKTLIKDAYKNLKPQMVILDSKQVKKIMTSSAAEQRQFMSRLSDSERRRVLQMWQKIKDDEEPTPIPETTPEPTPESTPTAEQSDEVSVLLAFDTLLSNAYIDPSQQHALQSYMEHHSNIPNDAVVLANSLLNDEDIAQDVVDNYTSLFTELGFTSTFADYYDLIETKDVDLDIDEEIQTAAEDDAEMATDRSFPTLSDASIARFVNRGYNPQQVRDSYMRHFTMAYRSRISDSTTAHVLSKIKIADLAPAKAFDKVDAPDDTKPSVLEMVESAMQSYVNGNSEPLELLAQSSVDELYQKLQEENGSSSEPTELQEPADNQEPQEPAEPAELQEPADEPTLTSKEDLQQIISLAKSLLEKTSNSATYDSLVNRGFKFAKKYNLRISDCDQSIQPLDEGTVIDPSMTIEDYYGIAPMVPCGFGPVAHALYHKDCAPVETWEQKGNTICVNGCQNYFPCYPIEEITAKLNEPNANLQKIIGSTCIDMTDACKCAASMDCLSVIDNRFYHKSHRDSAWYFDEVPACLEGQCEGPHSVTLQHTLNDCSDKQTVYIYGTPYTLQ